MNKKGFTLVELLAVIAILAILATIATPLIMNVSNKTKDEMFKAKAKTIRAAAVMCAEEIGEDNCKTVKDLCKKDYLDVAKDCSSSSDNCDCQQNPLTGGSMDSCAIYLDRPNKTNRYEATFPVSGETKADCKGLN